MPPDGESDADLLAAHLGGDPHAFARLYDRYEQATFRFIRRTLGGAQVEAAEDLHQDTWTSVARSAAAFDAHRASFPAWLFTIARRKVWDHFRRGRVTVLASAPEALVAGVPDPGPTPLERVETRERAERVVAAVDALPLAQRETFVMFAHAELSLQEIAEATGVGLETAKSRLRYARASSGKRWRARERPISDREPRDPLDDAYVEAERLLEDAATRAARRARVLAAVATPAADASPAPRARRAARGRLGWAAAASVAGLAVLVATFVSRSVPPAPSPPVTPPDGVVRPPSGPPPVAVAPASSMSPGAAGTPPAGPPVSRPAASSTPASPAPRAAPPPPVRIAPPPTVEVPPPLPLPPTPAPVRQSEVPPAAALSEDKAALIAPAPAERSVARRAAAADEDAASTLRRAAASGRTAEVEAALNRGVPVDAPDANGDTALMLSVRGGHVATAALLRRRGADTERVNRAGDSAAALATASGDPRLEEALRAPRP